MSRSRKKSRVAACIGGCDSYARQLGNRQYRRTVKIALSRIELDAEPLPCLREHSNKYNWPTDDSAQYVPINNAAAWQEKQLRK